MMCVVYACDGFVWHVMGVCVACDGCVCGM